MATMMNVMCLAFLLVLAVTSALPANNAVEANEGRVQRAAARFESAPALSPNVECTITCTWNDEDGLVCKLECTISFSASARRRRTADIEGMPDSANYTYEDLLAAFDTDCNGAISACEWIERDSKLADFVAIWENVDLDGDDMVSLEELKTLPDERPNVNVDMNMMMSMDKYDEMMEIVEKADEQPGKGRKTDEDDE